MDGAGTQFALRHTFDDRLGAHLRITTGEDTLTVGHKVMRIGLDCLPLRPLHPGFFVEHTGIHGLTNGRNNSIARDYELRTRNRNRATAATGIGLSQLVTLELHASGNTILLHDARLTDVKLEIRALGLTIFDLFHSSPHFVTATAIHGMDLRAQA